jgi:hypothetical protein
LTEATTRLTRAACKPAHFDLRELACRKGAS